MGDCTLAAAEHLNSDGDTGNIPADIFMEKKAYYSLRRTKYLHQHILTFLHQNASGLKTIKTSLDMEEK